MKKASRLLFSNLNRHGFGVAAPPLIFTRTAHSPSALSSSPLNSTFPRLLQSPAKSPTSTFNTRRFFTNPSRNDDNPAENTTRPFPKPREKSDLVQAFESAKTTEEMIRVFEEMEAMEGFFNKKELGIASLKIGRKLEREGAEPRRFFPFADKALKLFRGYDLFSIPVVLAFQLMGYYHHALNKFDDLAIERFEAAADVLEYIKKNGLINSEDIMAMQQALQTEEYVSHDEALWYTSWHLVLKNWGVGSVSLRAEIEAADKQTALGSHDEAVYALARIIEKTKVDSEDRALACVSMAKALFRRGNRDDSINWIVNACWILDKKSRARPFEVYTAYLEMAKLLGGVGESHELRRGDRLPTHPELAKRANALQAIVYIRVELSKIYLLYHAEGLEQEAEP